MADDPMAAIPTTPAISPLSMFGGQGGGTPGLGSAGASVGGGLNNMISALMKGMGSGSGAAPYAQTGTTPGGVALFNSATPAGPGGFEGNVASPANPFNPSTGQFGMPAHQMPPQAHGSPPPFTGQMPPQAQGQGNPFVSGARPMPFMTAGGAPSGQQPMPPNPFTQGTSPTPFLNANALFGRPPMAQSPSNMLAQRPNPINQMQL